MYSPTHVDNKRRKKKTRDYFVKFVENDMLREVDD